jgi:excisionase family DNA binding protein
MGQNEKAEGGTARLTLNVEEAGRLLGLSRGAAYQAAKTGEIPVIRIGGRVLVPRVQLDQLLEGKG